MGVANFNDLRNHVGHRIVCVMYAGVNAAIECETCNEVLLDFDLDGEEASIGQKYEVLYYNQTGGSDPLTSKDEVKALLQAEGFITLTDEDIEAGNSFVNTNGELMLISSYDDEQVNKEEEVD
jgi:hypothetical protein